MKLENISELSLNFRLKIATEMEVAPCYKMLTVIKLPSAYTVNTVCIIYCQDRNTKQALASDYIACHCSHSQEPRPTC